MKSPTLESSDGVLRDIGADRAVVTHHDAARRAAKAVRDIVLVSTRVNSREDAR